MFKNSKALGQTQDHDRKYLTYLSYLSFIKTLDTTQYSISGTEVFWMPKTN